LKKGGKQTTRELGVGGKKSQGSEREIIHDRGVRNVLTSYPHRAIAARPTSDRQQQWSGTLSRTQRRTHRQKKEMSVIQGGNGSDIERRELTVDAQGENAI